MAGKVSDNPNEFLLPDLGEGLQEAELIEWCVKPGQRVNEFDTIAKMETDKALVELPADPSSGKSNVMVIGQVVAMHLDDAFVREGRFDTARAQPVARLGYLDFAVVTDAFAIERPRWPLTRTK